MVVSRLLVPGSEPLGLPRLACCHSLWAFMFEDLACLVFFSWNNDRPVCVLNGCLYECGLKQTFEVTNSFPNVRRDDRTFYT